MAATATVPNDLQPYFDKGIQAYTQGSYEYAVDLLTFVIKRAPDATEARRYLRLAIQKQFSQHPPSSRSSRATPVKPSTSMNGSWDCSRARARCSCAWP